MFGKRCQIVENAVDETSLQQIEGFLYFQAYKVKIFIATGDETHNLEYFLTLEMFLTTLVLKISLVPSNFRTWYF